MYLVLDPVAGAAAGASDVENDEDRGADGGVGDEAADVASARANLADGDVGAEGTVLFWPIRRKTKAAADVDAVGDEEAW